PTVVLFKDGHPVDGFAGIQPESAIRAMLEPHVSAAPAEEEVEDVQASVTALLDAGQPEQAITLLQQAMAEHTSDPLLLLLARALMDTRQFDDVEAVLNAVQDQDGNKQALAGLGTPAAAAGPGVHGGPPVRRCRGGAECGPGSGWQQAGPGRPARRARLCPADRATARAAGAAATPAGQPGGQRGAVPAGPA